MHPHQQFSLLNGGTMLFLFLLFIAVYFIIYHGSLAVMYYRDVVAVSNIADNDIDNEISLFRHK